MKDYNIDERTWKGYDTGHPVSVDGNKELDRYEQVYGPRDEALRKELDAIPREVPFDVISSSHGFKIENETIGSTASYGLYDEWNCLCSVGVTTYDAAGRVARETEYYVNWDNEKEIPSRNYHLNKEHICLYPDVNAMDGNNNFIAVHPQGVILSQLDTYHIGNYSIRFVSEDEMAEFRNGKDIVDKAPSAVVECSYDAPIGVGINDSVVFEILQINDMNGNSQGHTFFSGEYGADGYVSPNGFADYDAKGHVIREADPIRQLGTYPPVISSYVVRNYDAPVYETDCLNVYVVSGPVRVIENLDPTINHPPFIPYTASVPQEVELSGKIIMVYNVQEKMVEIDLNDDYSDFSWLPDHDVLDLASDIWGDKVSPWADGEYRRFVSDRGENVSIGDFVKGAVLVHNKVFPMTLEEMGKMTKDLNSAVKDAVNTLNLEAAAGRDIPDLDL